MSESAALAAWASAMAMTPVGLWAGWKLAERLDSRRRRRAEG